MIKTVKGTIESNHMISDVRPIVVGVSGGPDSMALLHILSNMVKNTLIVAHLNHQFRDQEAKKDAQLVKNYCNEMGIEVVINEYDVPKYMKANKLGAEEAARKIRYQFYLDVAKKWNAGYVALGHHANDQAETIIMRIIRGTGSHGLSGIPYKRNFEGLSLIRPLLDTTREEIEHFVAEHSIPYRIDQSNYSTKFFRNKIRLNILPTLLEYNEKLITHLSQMAKVNQAEDQYLRKKAEEFLEQNLVSNGNYIYSMHVSQLQHVDIALQRRVIHLILTYLNLKEEFNYQHIEKVIYLIQQSYPSKSLDLPGLRVYREYEKVIFSTLTEQEITPYAYELPIPGVVEIPQIKKQFRAFISEQKRELAGLWDIFDGQLIKGKKIIIRTRKDGDRIQIKGMNGSKKVKDIFIDQKIPKEWRKRLPIIEVDGEILWIPGVKQSSLMRVTETTTLFLYIQMGDLGME
ncbi:tRNA lysidine(34) synthetase TilS [Tepidibacillus marianensis]|uniref:tRNA lysidine(34) synthetase TilS n=1 Tax=Tepidibacillus marianensis TaxID=3131995 RepID=UPI0030CD0C53